VLTLVPIFFLPWLVEIPAVAFLALWFVAQLFSAFVSLGEPATGGVAWWAHVGGFVAGIVLVKLMAPSRRPVVLHEEPY
jgi:membrane associated rhomboid family serine protease